MWSNAGRRGLLLGCTLALMLGLAGAAPVVTAEITPPEAPEETPTDEPSFTVSYVIENPGPDPQTYQPVLGLPAGWTALVPPAPVTLAPGERQTGLLLLQPPALLAPGRYPLGLEVGDSRVTLELNVPARPELLIISAPTPLYANATYDLEFTVRNAGNVDQQVTFTAMDSLQEGAQPFPGSALIKAGAEQVVRVRVGVPAFARGAEQRVFFQAKGLSSADTTAQTEVVARRIPLSATYYTLPFTAYLLALYQGEQFSWTWGLSGEGELRDGSLVGFDVQPNSVRGSYQRGPVEVAGYASGGARNPLSFGVRGAYRMEKVVWSAQVGGPSLSYGAGVNAMLSPQWVVGGSVSGALSGLQGWSAHLGYTTLSDATRDRSWQASLDGRVSGSPGGAWAAGATATVTGPTAGGSLGYEAQHQKGETVQTLAAAAQVNVQRVQLGASGRSTWTAGAERPDLAFSVAASTAWTWGKASATYQYRRPPVPTATQPVEDAVRVRLDTTGTVRTAQTLEWNRGRANTLNYVGSLGLSTGFGLWQPGVTANYNLATQQSRYGAQLVWSYLVNPRTAVQLGVGRPDLAENRWNLSAGARLSAQGLGSVGLGAGVQLAEGRAPAYSFSLSTVVQNELPVGRRTDLAQVSGTVTDQGGQPVSNLLVRLGPLTARTDASGQYRFQSVPAGVYYLTLDSTQLGVGLVATPPLPRRLELTASSQSRLDLQIMPASSIRGAVRFQAVESQPGQVVTPFADEQMLIRGLVLELQHESGLIFQTTSDPRGNFTFTGLVAGTWTLSVVNGPALRHPDLVVEADRGSFSLAAGELAEAVIVVQPRVREVEVEDGGTLTPIPVPAAPPPQVP